MAIDSRHSLRLPGLELWCGHGLPRRNSRPKWCRSRSCATQRITISPLQANPHEGIRCKHQSEQANAYPS
eukprot:4488453-Amphidinium_carterae.1